MFFSFFLFLASSLKYTIVAVDNKGNKNQFLTFSINENSKSIADIVSITEATFESKEIQSFEILRPDGCTITCLSPAITKALNFKVNLIEEVPVSFEATTAYRGNAHHVNLLKEKTMQPPVYQDFASGQESSGGGIMSKLVYILPVILLFNLFGRGGGGAAPAAK